MQAWVIDIRKKLNSEIIAIPHELTPKHLPGLDGLRGISILIVILGHLLNTTSLGSLYIGNVGVDTFFVISGFLITTLLLKERVTKGKISLRHFYVRRALRILPVAYLFIVVLIILNHIYHLQITSKSFLTAALYLKNIPFKNAGEWYTGPFWSLSVEEQYYLIFPALLVYMPARYIYIIAFAVLFIPVISYIGYHNIGDLQGHPSIHLIVFIIINVFGKGTISILIGSATAILVFKNIIKIEKLQYNYWLSTILLIVGIALEIFTKDRYVCPVIFALIISFVILNTLSQKTFLHRLLEIKSLVYIGVISYSLYIWQQIFTSSQPWANQFPFSSSCIFNVIALFTVATASYYLYELKFLRLKKYFK